MAELEKRKKIDMKKWDNGKTLENLRENRFTWHIIYERNYIVSLLMEDTGITWIEDLIERI